MTVFVKVIFMTVVALRRWELDIHWVSPTEAISGYSCARGTGTTLSEAFETARCVGVVHVLVDSKSPTFHDDVVVFTIFRKVRSNFLNVIEPKTGLLPRQTIAAVGIQKDLGAASLDIQEVTKIYASL